MTLTTPTADRTATTTWAGGFTRSLTKTGAWCALLTMPAIAWASFRLTVELATEWSPMWLVEDAMLLTAAGFATAIAAYLALVGAAMVVTAVAGAKVAASRLSLLAPPSWRRVAAAALGFSFAAGVASPTLASEQDSAAAGDSPLQIAWIATPDTSAATADIPTPAPSLAPTEAPVTTEAPQATADTVGTAAITAPPVVSSPASTSTAKTYTVERGDSLWSITSDLLGGDATEGEVARAWPELYEANRDVVGADPGLIFAGQSLRVPASIA